MYITWGITDSLVAKKSEIDLYTQVWLIFDKDEQDSKKKKKLQPFQQIVLNSTSIHKIELCYKPTPSIIIKYKFTVKLNIKL